MLGTKVSRGSLLAVLSLICRSGVGASLASTPLLANRALLPRKTDAPPLPRARALLFVLLFRQLIDQPEGHRRWASTAQPRALAR
jgi:hypothetical protein